MPTGLVPAFSSDLKNTEESSIAGPPGGTFDFVGKMPPSASFTAVYGQSPLDEGSSTEALAFVVSKVSSHSSARSPEEDSSATVAVPRAFAASDGPEARKRCETHRALRAGTETPARRCAPETTRRAGAARAALGANVALDADAIARG
jgi:hypothetical protein